MMLRNSKIVICPRCSGKGALLEATGGPDVYRVIDCPMCGGARVMEKYVSIKYRRVNGDEGREATAAMEAGGPALSEDGR